MQTPRITFEMSPTTREAAREADHCLRNVLIWGEKSKEDIQQSIHHFIHICWSQSHQVQLLYSVYVLRSITRRRDWIKYANVKSWHSVQHWWQELKLFTDLSPWVLARPLAETVSPWIVFQRGTERNKDKEIYFMH